MRRPSFSLLLSAVLVFSTISASPGFAGALVDVSPSPLNSDTFSKLYEKSRDQVVVVVPSAGTGSGFVWTSDGYILTNAHVVRNEKTVNVYVGERKHYEAKVVASDTEFDVALLKIDGKLNLMPVTSGDSDLIKPGDWVYAIGSPFSLRYSLNVGVVSGLRRNITGGIQETIQVDVVINPGNSGGPLYNLYGEVIGMNVAKVSEDGGIGFAIPINDVIFVARELLRSGKIKYARLGIGIYDLSNIPNEAVAKKNDVPWPLPQKAGIMVARVEPGSSAEVAGVRKGDLVKSFNGKEADDLPRLRRQIALSPTGMPIPLVVKRGGAEIILQVVLAERPPGALEAEKKEEKNEDTPSPDPAPAPVPAPVPQEGRLNLGEGLTVLPPQVGRAIMEYQGLLSEVSIGFGGQIQLRSTNAFAVDSQYVVTVASFLNPNAHYAFTAKYIFNGIPANLASVAPPGLALFKLKGPYPNYKNPLVWSDKVKVGNVYHSLVIKNPGNGDSLPYIERLLNKVGQALIFSAKLKKIGYGAPVFNSDGEVIGMWLAADKNNQDPEDVYDSTVVAPADLIKKFVETVIEQNKDKK